jgi:hypothetical protein
MIVGGVFFIVARKPLAWMNVLTRRALLRQDLDEEDAGSFAAINAIGGAVVAGAGVYLLFRG